MGIDIIEIRRIDLAIKRWRDRFLKRVYTDLEIERYHGRTESLAARFAGKEAVIKALGGEISIIQMKEIEILAEDNGRPVVKLHGSALAQLLKLGLTGIEISLSHSRENAVALAIGTREDLL